MKHILNSIGILLMAAVILCMVPVTVPKLFGIHIYGVRTGSMTPTYPVGGVVYVAETLPESIVIGDVITYTLGSDNPDYVQTHRVMDITEAGFVTKGDGNNTPDPEPVAPHRLVGKVVFSLPFLDSVLTFLGTTAGRCAMIVLFCISFACFIAAELVSPRKKGNSKADRASDRTSKAGEHDGASIGKRSFFRDNFLQIAGLVLILGAAVYLGSIFLGYKGAADEYDALAAPVLAEISPSAGFAADIHGDGETQPAEADNEAVDTMPSAEEEARAERQDAAMADLIASLKQQNADTIGWIVFDDLNINYPIMHGTDNEYYLHHTFSGRENSSGSIFMEAANTEDFLDYHTIIYGHNMKNGSMFGSLKKYRDEGFYEENAYFTVYTENVVYRYRIFAYYDIPADGEIYQIYFSSQEDYERLQRAMLRRSYRDTDVTVTGDDDVLTLSTCSSIGNRFVVNAIRVGSRKIR